MKTWVKYILLAIAFAILSCGVVVSAFYDQTGTYGATILWLAVPTTVWFMAAVCTNETLMVPSLLLKGRPGVYAVASLALAFVCSYMGVWMEHQMRTILGMSLRIRDISSLRILADSFSNALLLSLVLLGLGAWSLYGKWKENTEYESRCAQLLQQYISIVRKRFNKQTIIGGIDRIMESLDYGPSKAVEELHKLSAYLRQQLYDLPSPPAARACEPVSDFKSDIRLTEWLAGSRWRLGRHVVFFIIIAVVSFTLFFDVPDKPAFNLESLLGFITTAIVLEAVACINVFLLFPRFLKQRKVRPYLFRIGLVVIITMLPLFIVGIDNSGEETSGNVPRGLSLISLAGSALTLFLFMAGIGSILLLQEWIRGHRQMALLHAETVRQEYAYLRKQINPHFLFNVLNNTSILLEEDSEEAFEMLSELRRLLSYQFSETDRQYTTIGREIDFLQSYLNLEETRIEPFGFEIHQEGDIAEVKVPTLLFIPFVENAVKYSSVVDGERSVEVKFAKTDNKIRFTCVNTFSHFERHEAKPGGIGLTNTRRRLELLYGSRCRLTMTQCPNKYIITLTIPYQDEMCNN